MIALKMVGIVILIMVALFALIFVHALCALTIDDDSDLEKELANILYNFLNDQP